MQNEELCDVVFVIQGKNLIVLVRSIVASFSPVLKSMMCDQLTESKTKNKIIINIDDVKPETFDFFYQTY